MESGKRSLAKNVTKKVTEASEKNDQKVTERVPKTKKKVIELLLPTSFCGTLIFLCAFVFRPSREISARYFRKIALGNSFFFSSKDSKAGPHKRSFSKATESELIFGNGDATKHFSVWKKRGSIRLVSPSPSLLLCHAIWYTLHIRCRCTLGLGTLPRSGTEPAVVVPWLCGTKKKRAFSEKGGGNSVKEGFGKDFYKKGNSVKRSGHSLNRRSLKIEKLLCSSPSRKSAPNRRYFRKMVWGTEPTTFLCILFSFFSPVRPTPCPGNFLPQNPLFLGPQLYSFS